jgi:hypothetical protein
MAGRKHPFIPEFRSEDEEREFWEQVDVAKFIECPADEIVLELRPKRRRRKKVTSEVSEVWCPCHCLFAKGVARRSS